MNAVSLTSFLSKYIEGPLWKENHFSFFLIRFYRKGKSFLLHFYLKCIGGTRFKNDEYRSPRKRAVHNTNVHPEMVSIGDHWGTAKKLFARFKETY